MDTVVELTGRQKVLSRIETDMFSQQISNVQLATAIKSDYSSLCVMLNGGREFDCSVLLQALRIIYPDDICKRRAYYWIYFKDQMTPMNACITLELSNLLGELTSQKRAIEAIKRQFKGSRDASLKIVNIYELLYRRSMGLIKPSDFLKSVEELKKKQRSYNLQVKILMDFAYVYSHIGMKEYRVTINYLLEIEKLIQQVKKKFLKKSFNIRVNELLALSYHRNNNLELARQKCLEIINGDSEIYPIRIANAYFILGQTYLLSDYQIANGYLKKALDIIKNTTNKRVRLVKENILNTINFLKIYHKRDLLNLDIDKESSEFAYLYCALDQKDKAVKFLNERKKINGSWSAFELFYMGLATGNPEYFILSKQKFLITGDLYYVQILDNYL